MSRIDGKIALITGAARGIGAETARVLATAGGVVIVTDRDRDGGRKVAREITGSGCRAEFIALDVSDETSWQSAMQRVEAHFGGLDILVNNAGIVVVGPIEHTSLADLERICRVNLHGTFLALKHAVPLMKARARASEAGGSIVNVSSAVGIKGYPFGAAYSMTKGGVRLLTKSAALEFAELGYNIRVNSIHPGLVETPMLEQEAVEHAGLASLGSDSATQTRRIFEDMAPIKRFARPVEIARAVLFLASDDSSFMTGSELVVDGGDTAS